MADNLAENSCFMTPHSISKNDSQEDIKESQVSTPSLPHLHDLRIEYALSLEKKYTSFENTEAVLRYSMLLQEVNKMMRLIQTLRRESKIIARIKKILSFSENVNSRMIEEMLKVSPQAHRVTTKITNLGIIYENLNNHRNFLADYLVLYLGSLLDNFRIFKSLDYRRVFYVRKQINKCKSLLLASIKEGCPSLCKKFFEITKSKLLEKNREKAKERRNELSNKESREFGDIVHKKIRPI